MGDFPCHFRFGCEEKSSDGLPVLLLVIGGCTSGSRTDREITNIQDYFLGLTSRKLRDYGKHWAARTSDQDTTHAALHNTCDWGLVTLGLGVSGWQCCWSALLGSFSPMCVPSLVSCSSSCFCLPARLSHLLVTTPCSTKIYKKVQQGPNGNPYSREELHMTLT